MGMQFRLTVTANFSDGSEISDIDVADPVLSDDIGDTALTAASEARHALQLPPVDITSLVIIAVVA